MEKPRIRQGWQLKSNTLEMIHALEKANWFADVGKSISDPNIISVHSWKEAIKYCKSRYCANVQMEGTNLLHETLWHLHLRCKMTERYMIWNTLVDVVKDQIRPIIELKTRDVIKLYRLPKAFCDTVDWDIMAICMELEYADSVPPRFFAERAKWYLAGHFPCGWEGDFPIGGKLVVF